METPDTKNKVVTPSESVSSTCCADWHVWHVGSSFYAAETLEDAIQEEMHSYAQERDDLSWDDAHCDHDDYYDNMEGEGDPVCMCQRAAELIKEGQTMPFEFARELN